MQTIGYQMCDRDFYIFEDNNEFFVKEGKKRYKVELNNRLFRFAVDTIQFLGTLPEKKEFNVFRYQLSKSATSIGANYEEAQGGVSSKDFAHKIGICLKEAKETNYFFRVINALHIGDRSVCERLTDEADQLQRIFGSILVKFKQNRNM